MSDSTWRTIWDVSLIAQVVACFVFGYNVYVGFVLFAIASTVNYIAKMTQYHRRIMKLIDEKHAARMRLIQVGEGDWVYNPINKSEYDE